MKKILFVIAVIIMLGFTASAQTDGFFRGEVDVVNRGGDGNSAGVPMVPTGYDVGTVPDSDAAPLGNGIAILAALGAGYMLKRNKR